MAPKPNNSSIGKVSSVSNLVIKNDVKVDFKVEITKSRWDGKEFVAKQEKEFKVAAGKKLKLKSIFK